MSTRSNIGILGSNGTIRSIYCHWDGYPAHNGRILLEHFKDEDKINQLIELGSLSSLGCEVNPDPEHKHSFEQPQKGVTVAYLRDRGDEVSNYNKINVFFNQKTYFENKNWIEYAYLWDGEKWLVNGQILTEEMCRK
jgi:hypothetical protein